MFKLKAAATIYIPFFLAGICIGLGEVTVLNLNKKIERKRTEKWVKKDP